MDNKKKKVIHMERVVARNKILRKIGLDTDNSFSWMENEKGTWGYRPRIAKRGNFLHTNYIVFSELLNLLSKKNPDKELNKREIFNFLRRNRIKPIKKKDVNQAKVNALFDKLKTERKDNNWKAGDNDLRIISVYCIAGINCISTNNRRDFQDPCNYLNIDLDVPTIIEPGSEQEVNKMLRNFSKNKHSNKKKRH